MPSKITGIDKPRVSAGDPLGRGGQWSPTIKPGEDVKFDDAPRSDRSEKVKGLLDDLEQNIQSIDSWDELAERMAFYSQFHQYSSRNALLIYIQNPAASVVGSYKKMAEMGLQVRKGEKAMSVLAPLLVNDKEHLDADGNPQKKLVGFKTVPVFDISQCDEIPGFEETHQSTIFKRARSKMAPGEVPPGMREAITKAIESYGYTVRGEDRSLLGATGLTIPSEKSVVFTSTSSEIGQVGTLAHELGHIMLGHADAHHSGTPADPNDHAIKEVAAEAVSYVLLNAWGVSNDQNTADLYASSWSHGSNEIFREAAKSVMGKIDKLPWPDDPS